MTQPVPEESNEAYDLDEAPPGEHDSQAPDASDATDATTSGEVTQEENAETSLDQPSQ
ncbi:hypothetical protein [Nocardioides rubriscoriae]|uniref:hypothetical protein n=1 Tax=Nocardioides rubriscoriae TaxID=642762 RepID=UPI0014797C9F|nr:hypothetical protein [Nocardioides rubriscoriae]